MKMLECKRVGVFDVGFIDPNHNNAVTIRDHCKDTEDNILRFLWHQRFKPAILFPYNFG